MKGIMYRAAIGVAALAAAIAVAPAPAHAYTLQENTTANCGGAGQDPMRFTSSSVAVVIHYGEARLGPFDLLKVVDAIMDVTNEMNDAGGTDIQIASITSTADPFHYGTTYNDTTPTIHVGFQPSLSVANAIGVEVPVGPLVNCEYTEAHISFLDLATQRWDFGEPAEYYYSDGTLPANTTNVPTDDDTLGFYFRPIYQHELLHAFGLAHSDKTFAFMNYGATPWANRLSGHKIRPLPDDLRALRYLYPDTSSKRYDVAVLNSWDDDTHLSAGKDPKAAYSTLLCAATVGPDFDTDPAHRFSPYGCAAAGSPTGCEGDSLKTRFALVNYGTDEVEGTASLYLSTDAALDFGTDTFVNDFDVSLIAAGYKLISKPWKLPALATGTKYLPIVSVTMWKKPPAGQAIDSSTITKDWIPLRGSVTGC